MQNTFLYEWSFILKLAIPNRTTAIPIYLIIWHLLSVVNQPGTDTVS